MFERLSGQAFSTGDEVNVLSLEQISRDESATIEQSVVIVDANNKILDIKVKEVK